MKIFKPSSGYTLLECLVLAIVVAVIFVVFLPNLIRKKPQGTRNRVQCVINLKNIGLAFRIYASDNDDKFPMFSISTNLNQTYLSSRPMYEYWEYFRMLSNELSTPKLLVCSKDANRSVAESWTTFNGLNLSYFIGLNADERRPLSLLSGDRNLTVNGSVVGKRIIELKPDVNTGWTREMHGNWGCIGLGEGSVQMVTSNRFDDLVRDNWEHYSNTTWLAVP